MVVKRKRIQSIPMSNFIDFKQVHSLPTRRKEADQMLAKYPDRTPVIVQRMHELSPAIDQKKYLIPIDFTIGQVMCVLRRRIALRREEAMFLFINNAIPSSSALMHEEYAKHKHMDGFLYIYYSLEATFGYKGIV
jgi:GABA(A) receptor-associated protein